MTTPELDLEKEFQKLTQQAESLREAENDYRNKEVDEIQRLIKTGVYALTEDLDDEMAKGYHDDALFRLDVLKRNPGYNPTVIQELAPNEARMIQEFHDELHAVAQRYRSTLAFMETKGYRTGTKILAELIGKDRAQREIDRFFYEHSKHFTQST